MVAQVQAERLRVRFVELYKLLPRGFLPPVAGSLQDDGQGFAAPVHSKAEVIAGEQLFEVSDLRLVWFDGEGCDKIRAVRGEQNETENSPGSFEYPGSLPLGLLFLAEKYTLRAVVELPERQ